MVNRLFLIKANKQLQYAAWLVEPGYYADGSFGIRIENIVIVKKVETPNNFGDKGYLGFEHVTMVRPSSRFGSHRNLSTNRAKC